MGCQGSQVGWEGQDYKGNLVKEVLLALKVLGALQVSTRLGVVT